MKRRLTESDLKKIISTSVERVLNEISYKMVKNASEDMTIMGQHERAKDLKQRYFNQYEKDLSYDSPEWSFDVKPDGRLYLYFEGLLKCRFSKENHNITPMIRQGGNWVESDFSRIKINDVRCIVKLVKALKEMFYDADNIDEVNKNTFRA